MLSQVSFRDGTDLHVDYYPHLLDPDLAEKWYQYLLPFFAVSTRRTGLLFGDPGLVYTVTFRGKTNHRPVLPWSELPPLLGLKSLVEQVTQQSYTVCAMQYYPSGRIGIAPHRDKEMVLGTRICGLSLGATRTISFSRAWTPSEPTSIPLTSGSLYVMQPPTNSKYTHTILKDGTLTGRISLTFRDYRP